MKEMNHRGTETQKKNIQQPLSQHEVMISKQIIDTAINIHKILGPGLLESVYEKCFAEEMSLRGFKCERQKRVEIYYKGIPIDEGLRIDLLIDDLVIIEFKAQEIHILSGMLNF